MKAVVVYESMYGNTHLIADAIADGLRPSADVVVASVADITSAEIADADLLVVGGPTHVHGMTRPSTRKGAIEAAAKPESDVVLDADPDAYGEGLREWFDSLGELPRPAAAFDTRVHLSPAITGRASKGIAQRLRRHGATLVVAPESFFVTKENHLEPDEESHAREWGVQLAGRLDATTSA
jgi:menaquinone-dependent protoporphyrinogen IX oxidase